MVRAGLSPEERRYVEELRAWRVRRGLTKKALAEGMAYDPSRVSHIESGRQPPTEAFTRQAESVLQTGGALWVRWQAVAGVRLGLPPRPPSRDLSTADLVGWLADHSDQTYPTIYAAVSAEATRLEAMPAAFRHQRGHAHRGTTRAQIADVVKQYYASGVGAFYRVALEDTQACLSILTQPDWVSTAVPLDDQQPGFQLLPAAAPSAQLDDLGLEAAIKRLAVVEVSDTVLVNNLLYRLLTVAIEDHGVAGAIGLTDFATYALTSDLLEEELYGAIVTMTAGDRRSEITGRMPLRDTYLPDRASALDFEDRVCVGGPVALMAIARTSSAGVRDYLLLVQERSSSVLNVTGRLAVIPKAFHQPLEETAGEVELLHTLERELEEELLGRDDLEHVQASSGPRPVAALHPRQASAPFAWLRDRRGTGAYRTECTGFGVNMVTGNYEFASLIVVDDDDWWAEFGHLVVTNWEAEHVYCLSSLDTAGLRDLTMDPRWSNEGLFAFLQGLRRLTEIDTAGRVAAPAINLEI